MRRSGVRSSSSPPESQGPDTLRAFSISGLPQLKCRDFPPVRERRRRSVRTVFGPLPRPSRSPFSVPRTAPFARPAEKSDSCEGGHVRTGARAVAAARKRGRSDVLRCHHGNIAVPPPLSRSEDRPRIRALQRPVVPMRSGFAWSFVKTYARASIEMRAPPAAAARQSNGLPGAPGRCRGIAPFRQRAAARVDRAIAGERAADPHRREADRAAAR